MSDGWAHTPESGEQQPQTPSATPPQGPVPDPAFPSHSQPQPGFPPPAGFPPQATTPPSGYGYAQQPQGGQGGYGYPEAQGGYGYPQAQGGYGYPPPATAAEPNWYSLAEQAETTARKRKLRYMIGGGVLAAALVAGVLVFALNGPATPKPKPVPTPTASPSPTPTGPTTALEVLSDSKYDGSSTDDSRLFPLDHITVNGRTYVRTATEGTKTGGCDQPVTPDLGSVLVAGECLQLHRATYLNGNVGVTLGFAEFTNATLADKVKATATGSLLSLSGAKTTPYFCHGVTCLTSQNSLGRFAYFTIAGKTDNTAAIAGDTASLQAGRDLADYAHATLLARGEAELAVLQANGLAPKPATATASPSASPSH